MSLAPASHPYIHLMCPSIPARGTRNNPHLNSWFLNSSLIQLIPQGLIIHFATSVVGTDLHNNLWLLTLSLENVLQKLRAILAPVTREATRSPPVQVMSPEIPVSPPKMK